MSRLSGTVKLSEAEHGSSQQEMERSPGTAEYAVSGSKDHRKHHLGYARDNAFPSVCAFSHALCLAKCRCRLFSSKLTSSKNSLCFMLTVILLFFFSFLILNFLW